MRKCLICQGNTKIYKRYDRETLINAYLHRYGVLPKGINESHYELNICTECGLVFANIEQAGDKEYYEWVTDQEGYYASERWEWVLVSNYLKKFEKCKILEVGCGEGAFLDYLKRNNPSVEAIGIDLTPSSVEVCKTKGLNAFCGTLEDYLKENPNIKFDITMSFHCLEHLTNPNEFLDEMLLTLNKGGLCINAIPYTVLTDEPWLDPLNLPPHHITRWSEKNIREVGKQLGCDVDIICRDSFNVWNDTLTNLGLAYYPVYNHPKLYKKYWLIIKHPYAFLKEFRRNYNREKIECMENFNSENIKIRAPYHVTMVLKKESNSDSRD